MLKQRIDEIYSVGKEKNIKQKEIKRLVKKENIKFKNEQLQSEKFKLKEEKRLNNNKRSIYRMIFYSAFMIVISFLFFFKRTSYPSYIIRYK